MTVDCTYREQAGPASRIHLDRFHALHQDGQRLVPGWFEKAHTAMTADDGVFRGIHIRLVRCPWLGGLCDDINPDEVSGFTLSPQVAGNRGTFRAGTSGDERW